MGSPFWGEMAVGEKLSSTTYSNSAEVPSWPDHHPHQYRGADKSLAWPGRKQATATEDFEFHIS